MKWSPLFLCLFLVAPMACKYEYHGEVDPRCARDCGGDEDCLGGCEIVPPESGDQTDRDGDGLSDEDEGRCNTDPNRADTDGDGIADGDEDGDGDGFSNIDEIEAGSDPANGDSTPEAEAPAARVDSDGDGLSDEDEARCNTHPDIADTDGDGVPDGDEDGDGDGFSNIDEIAAGTDPADGDSAPVVDPPADDPPASDPVPGSCDTGVCESQPTCGSCEMACDGAEDPAFCLETCSGCTVTCIDDGCGNVECSFEGSCGYQNDCTSCESGWCGNSDVGGDVDVDVDCSSMNSTAARSSLVLLLAGLAFIPARRRRRQ